MEGKEYFEEYLSGEPLTPDSVIWALNDFSLKKINEIHEYLNSILNSKSQPFMFNETKEGYKMCFNDLETLISKIYKS